jgi:hypothetical protein
MNGKPWTEEEEQVLKDNYQNWQVTIDEIAERVGRSKGAVRAKARDLRLRRPLPTFLHHAGGVEDDVYSS